MLSTGLHLASESTLQHVLPTVGAVNIARAQGAALQIAELVEHEQRVIAGAFVMTVPDAHLLLAMGRADARNPCRGRRLAADGGHEPCRSIRRRGWRAPTGSSRPSAIASRSAPSGSPTPRIPRPPCRRRSAHRRIMAKPFGVVDVLVSSQPSEHRLPQHPDQRMPAVFAGEGVGQPLARHRAEAERVVEFAVGERTGVGGDDRTAKLQGQPAVEIEPQRLTVRFTRRVRHVVSFQISLTR